MKWPKDVNPYALQNMVERLLETIIGIFGIANQDVKKELRLYLELEGVLKEQTKKIKERKG